MARLKEYQTREDFELPGRTIHQLQVLPKYSFVQPMNPAYVPEHAKSRWIDSRVEGYYYTRLGIIVLPFKLVMELSGG